MVGGDGDKRRPTAVPPLPGMTKPDRPMHVVFNAPEGLARKLPPA
jgi:hypothetical protein